MIRIAGDKRVNQQWLTDDLNKTGAARVGFLLPKKDPKFKIVGDGYEGYFVPIGDNERETSGSQLKWRFDLIGGKMNNDHLDILGKFIGEVNLSDARFFMGSHAQRLKEMERARKAKEAKLEAKVGKTEE